MTTAQFLVSVLILCGGLVSAQIDDFDVLASELQLTDLDLEDFCEDVAVSSKKAFLNATALSDKTERQKKYANYLRPQASRLREFGNVSEEHLRNWTVLTKPGDTELNALDYEELVVFSNTLEGIVLHGNSSNSTNSKDNKTKVKVSKELWEEKVKAVSSYAKSFPGIFNLTKKAAIANNESDAVVYWETLSESPDMYSKLRSLWEEVEPLYRKLHKFVKKRLLKYYGLQDNNTTVIPVYLLGSEFGEDWSNIAEYVVPHPQLYQDVMSEIEHKNIRKIYRFAENMTKLVGLRGLGKRFWTESTFNSSNCNTVLFVHCSKRFTEVSTCNNLFWSSYLKVHEVAMEIALNNEDYISLPRRNLRFSGVDEAAIGLSTILAVNNLPLYGILEPDALKIDDNTYNNRMTALLLVALKVLPKLSYYVAAETWRIDEMQNQNGFVNLAEEWWKRRNEIQGVGGVTDTESDYLRDLRIIRNQPYLSNILGIFVEFQLYDYYYKNLYDENYNIATAIGEDSNFISLIRDRATKDWPSNILYYYGISEISTTPLLEYFQPLEEYLENAPEEQAPFVKKPPKKVVDHDENQLESTEKPKKKNAQLISKSPPIEEEQFSLYPTSTDLEEEAKEKKKHKNEDSSRAAVGIKDTQTDFQNDQEQEDEARSDSAKVKVENGETGKTQSKYTNDISQTVGTYIGIAVILCSVITIATVIIRQKFKKRRRPNNRRFET